MLLNLLRNLTNLIFKDEKNQTPPSTKVDSKWGNTIYQIFICLGPLTFCTGVGCMMGFSGIFLPQIKEETSPFKGSDRDISSWIASSAVLSMTLSTPFGGYLMEKIGRKRTHILASLPGALGWLTIAFSDDIQTLLIGRVLTGISCGMFAPVTSAYIGEVTAPSLRPFLLGCISLNVTIGTLLCHLVGTFYSWKTTALFSLAFPVLGGILTLFSEESPTWLFKKNLVEEACTTFERIRRKSEATTKELEVIVERHKKGELTQIRSLKEIASDVVSKPEIFKPLLLVVLYFMSAQFAGINVVTFYTIDIVKMSLGPDFKNSHLVMLVMDVTRTITSVLACILLKKMKRRHLAIGGGVFSLICLLTLSISDFLSGIIEGQIVSVYAPLVSLLAYVFFITVSLVPLPWCLAGELLPQEVKGLASSILCFTSFSAFFLAVKWAPFSFDLLGTGFTYLIFSGSALFGTLLCLFLLPETKNKTLNDIADAYRKKELKIDS